MAVARRPRGDSHGRDSDWDEDTLLKREEFLYPQGAGGDIAQKLALRAGVYQARVFIRREGRAAPEALTRELRLGDEETCVTSVR